MKEIFCLLLFGSLLSVLTESTTKTQSTYQDASPQNYRESVDVAPSKTVNIDSIEQAYKSAFPSFDAPTIRYGSLGVNTLGLYENHTQIVTLDRRWFASAPSILADYVKAHEYGHHLQNNQGLINGNSVQIELQAECLAGATFGAMDRPIDGVLQWVLDGTQGSITSTHGTGQQRVAAIQAGYFDGYAGCY